MLIEPVGHIEDDALDHDPEVLFLVVLGDLLHGVLLLGNLEVGRVGLGLFSGWGGAGGGGIDGRGRGTGGGSHGGQGAGGGTAPLDGDLAGGGGVDVQRDLAQTLLGAGAAADQLLEQVLAGGITGDTAVDNAAQQGGTTETVGAVDTAGQLTARVEAVEGLLLGVEDLGVLVDLDTAHGEVEDGLHDSNVELVVDVEGHVVEEALVPGVLLLAVGNEVVLVKGLLEGSVAAANLLGELLAAHLLHETTARVVAGVEVENLGGLAVQHQADGPLALLLLLPHLAGHVVTVAQLVREALAVRVQQQTTLTTEGLGSQELELGLRILGVDQTGRVDLDLVHVDAVGTDLHQHLLAVTSSVGAVGGGQAEGVGTVLLEQRSVAKVSGVTAGSQNDDTVDGLGLAVQGVGNTGNVVTVLVNAGDVGLLDDLDAVGLGVGELLKTLHQGIGDSHAGELGIVTTVCAGVGVATQTGNESEVEVEDVLQPLDGGSGLVSKDLDQVGARLVTSGLEGVVVELLDTVFDAELGLGAGERTVNAGGGLGGVTTEEG